VPSASLDPLITFSNYFKHLTGQGFTALLNVMNHIMRPSLTNFWCTGVCPDVMWCVCRRVNAPTVEPLEMDISPRVNQINLMTGNFLTMFDVPYTIQVFAENGIGEGAGSNTITFTRIQSTYTTICICSMQYRNLCNLEIALHILRICKLCTNLKIAH